MILLVYRESKDWSAIVRGFLSAPILCAAKSNDARIADTARYDLAGDRIRAIAVGQERASTTATAQLSCSESRRAPECPAACMSVIIWKWLTRAVHFPGNGKSSDGRQPAAK